MKIMTISVLLFVQRTLFAAKAIKAPVARFLSRLYFFVTPFGGVAQANIFALFPKPHFCKRGFIPKI